MGDDGLVYMTGRENEPSIARKRCVECDQELAGWNEGPLCKDCINRHGRPP